MNEINIKSEQLKKIICESVNNSIRDYFQTAEPELLTVAGAAELLGVSNSTIHSWVKNSNIPFIKPLGTKIFFSRMKLLEWVYNQKKEVTND